MKTSQILQSMLPDLFAHLERLFHKVLLTSMCQHFHLHLKSYSSAWSQAQMTGRYTFGMQKQARSFQDHSTGTLARSRPDGKRVVSGSHDTTIRIWDAKTGKVLSRPFRGHDNRVLSVTFSPTASTLSQVSGSHDKTVRIWDAEVVVGA
jgi:WD40 repeat protein